MNQQLADLIVHIEAMHYRSENKDEISLPCIACHFPAQFKMPIDGFDQAICMKCAARKKFWPYLQKQKNEYDALLLEFEMDALFRIAEGRPLPKLEDNE
jgi:hypothetical protein